MIYIIILILLLIGVRWGDNKPNDNRRIWNYYYWVCYLIIVLMFGLRYRVGGDTLNYIIKYDYISPLSDLSFVDLFLLQVEPGFAVLMAFFKQYTNDFYCVQIVESAFVNYVWFRIINKYVSRRFLGVSLYYAMFSFYFNTEIMREAIAVGIFVFAYEQLLNKKTLRYYAILLIGILFHYSCFFMVFIPFLHKYVTNPKKMLFIATLLVVLTFLVTPMFKYLGGYMATKVENNADYTFTVFGILGSILKTIIFPWIIWYLYKMEVSSKPNSEPLRYLLMYCVVGSLAIGKFSILMRLVNYLQPFFLVIFVRVIERIIIRKEFNTAILLVAFIWGFYLYPYFKDESDIVRGAHYYCIWYPYYSIFDEQEDLLRENFVSAQFEELNNRY